ncbi:type VI secretion protein IcmF/TssM N-terminal domain-containing protein [Limnoglobus roseus]|uniref:Type VI secretion system component TssM1 N-terminal domain-containing protein n=1 Tax=Limnoglobus roseus TaxID=2598579 RepID=A0A5C1ALD4_9BACT|nr:type VI secretion protein IcmF/TssM N-terminal domain-containing protein [Limnoglobus roseus]QEL20041.1 hypothetical protein PX52LOC_07127 [Limnoglobus roseus]
MQTLIQLFVAFVNGIRSSVGLVLPMFAEAADFRSWPRWVKFLVHVIALGSILYGLYWLNNHWPFIQKLLKSKATVDVQKVYLPLIFVLIYVLSWLGYFWWKLFNRGDAAEYPDIAAAWADATRKLTQAGIALGDAPLYLIVGHPSSGDDALFLAAGKRELVRAPLAVDSPLRVFASPDAIYVCCAGCSTWGAFVTALTSPEVSGVLDAGDSTDAGKTITPGQALQGVDEKVQEEFYRLLQTQSDRPLTAEEDARLRELGDMIQTTKAGGIRRVSLSNETLSVGPRRLAYLCRLIVQDRRPWCPLNGMMVLLPWGALDSDETCRTALSVLSADLSVARATFRQRYSHFVLVCDLEQADGFDEFRLGFSKVSKEMLKQRIGQRLPLVPDRPAEDVPAVMEQVADWIRLNVLAAWVMKFLRLEWPPEARRATTFIPGFNQKLFQFLHDLFVRGPRLARILSRGLPVEATALPGDTVAALPLVAGCYLAATGRDEKHQAFVPGVFQRMVEAQSAVSWSAEAVSEDRAYSQWTGLLYIAAVLLLAISGGVVYLQFFKT